MADTQNEIKLSITVPEPIKAGKYANLFNVTTTASKEVFIDFVFVHPQDRESNGTHSGIVVSRVLMSADNAIALKLALESQLGKNKKE